MAEMINKATNKSSVHNWLTIGRIILIFKDKGNVPSNFCPKARLPLIWKLLTGILADEMYEHLDKGDLVPQEQKCSWKNSQGIKYQLLYIRMSLRNCKTRQTGLAMGCINFKKVRDMVSHLWISKCMDDFFEIAFKEVRKIGRQYYFERRSVKKSKNKVRDFLG